MSSSDTPAAKRLKMEPTSQSPSGKSTPQPASGKSTPSSRYHLTFLPEPRLVPLRLRINNHSFLFLLISCNCWDFLTCCSSCFTLSDVQLTEEAVRRYLIRKPMTTKDLLKKFQTKRTGLSSEQTVNVLAQILKKLNPERKNINDKMHFYLTE